MQALACIADQIGQSPLDIHMHIFQSDLPVEPSRPDFLTYLRQSPLDIGIILFAQYLLRTQHLRMCQ